MSLPVTRDYYTPEETADILRTSVANIYRRVKRGLIPHKKLGKLILIEGNYVLPAGKSAPANDPGQEPPKPVKRGRGRPRKTPDHDPDLDP